VRGPSADLQEFLKGEVRYATLTKQFPDEAAKLQTKLAKEYAERWQMYKALAGGSREQAKS
jgi:pyruvate-ferredoxin/flavodoxin oxidoreductase